MPLHETEAFVLRTYSLAEADKICVFLTRDSGKVRGVAYGARKFGSRFGSALEPLTQVSLSFFEKEGRDLVSVSSCEILKSHFNQAARDFQTASAFEYIAELLIEFVPDKEPNERVYRLVHATLDAVDGSDHLQRMIRYFETWLLRLGGFFPDLSRCSACSQPVAAEATYLTPAGDPRCSECSSGRGSVVSPELRRTVTRLLTSRPEAFASLDVDSQVVNQLRDINYLIIRHVLERELRSPALLKQLGAW